MVLFLGCGVQGYSVEPPDSGRKVHFQELREEGNAYSFRFGVWSSG